MGDSLLLKSAEVSSMVSAMEVQVHAVVEEERGKLQETLMRDSSGSEEATTAAVEGKNGRQVTKIQSCLVLEEEIVDLVEAAEEEILLEVVEVDSIAVSTTADLDVNAHLSHFTTTGKFKETVEAEMRPDADGVIQQAGTVAVAISIAAQIPK